MRCSTTMRVGLLVSAIATASGVAAADPNYACIPPAVGVVGLGGPPDWTAAGRPGRDRDATGVPVQLVAGLLPRVHQHSFARRITFTPELLQHNVLYVGQFSVASSSPGAGSLLSLKRFAKLVYVCWFFGHGEHRRGLRRPCNFIHHHDARYKPEQGNPFVHFACVLA